MKSFFATGNANYKYAVKKIKRQKPSAFAGGFCLLGGRTVMDLKLGYLYFVSDDSAIPF